jgi:hypothetical protein
MEELNRVLATYRGELAVRVLFFTPSDAGPEWRQSSLWESAEAIPGVTVEADLDGHQARRFGAETSGDVLLYDRQGALLFQGGITAGRGHAGDNPGASAIVALLSSRQATTRETPVFGCSLLNPTEICKEETPCINK